MQFRPLDIGFRGRQSQWNVDRYQVLHSFVLFCISFLYSSVRILPIWQHGDLEPGRSYNYASILDRIEIRFRCLHIRFRGRQSQWNIDRHQVLYSSA